MTSFELGSASDDENNAPRIDKQSGSLLGPVRLPAIALSSVGYAVTLTPIIIALHANVTLQLTAALRIAPAAQAL